MKKRQIILLSLFGLLASLVAGLAAVTSSAAATFPVAELGNCRDGRECELFCEVPANKAACWSYQTYGDSIGSVLAETTTNPAQPAAAVTIFPIVELGSCADVQACKTYCDDPAHFTACTAVAQKHGLHRGAVSGQQTALLAHAKRELGCTSLAQCRAFCAEPGNLEQCQALAEKYGSLKHRLAKEKLLNNARSALGCQTLSDCQALCANPLNQERCRAFAQTKVPLHFLRKLKEKAAATENDVVSLPCTTLAECQAYCSDPANAAACDMSGEGGRLRINVQQPATFTCTSVEECERYCQANPAECPRYKDSPDYKNLLLQRELRNKDSAAIDGGGRKLPTADLERYRQSLIQKKLGSYSPTIVPPITTHTGNDFD